MNAVIILLLLAAPARGAADGSGFREDERVLQEMEREFNGIREQSLPLIEELNAIKENYLKSGRLKGVYARREKVAGRLEALLERLSRLVENFEQMRRNSRLIMMAKAVVGLSGGGLPKDAETGLGNLVAYENLHDKIIEFRNDLDDSLRVEKTAYRETREAIKRRRMLLLAGGGFFLAVFTVFGLLTWRRRKTAAALSKQ